MTTLQLLGIVENQARLGDFAGGSRQPHRRSAQQPAHSHVPVHRSRVALSRIDRRIARLNACLHQRESINPVVIARNVAWLLSQPEVGTQAELARRLDTTESWISRVLRILDLPGDLLGRVAVPQVLVSIGSLGQIAALQDRRWQGELIDALLGGKSESFIRAKIRQLKGTASGKRFKVDFKTCWQTSVTIRSRFKRLTPVQERQVLLDALVQLERRVKLDAARALG